MIRAAAGVLVSMMALASHQVASESPQRVEYCDLVRNPEQFASKTVVVQARLTELKLGEWGLDSHCFQPTLLVFADDVQPKPDFQTEKTEGVRVMLQARRERRVLFRGDFVGRFDVAEPGAHSRGDTTHGTFGKSRVRTRLVFRGVENPERIVIPKK